MKCYCQSGCHLRVLVADSRKKAAEIFVGDIVRKTGKYSLGELVTVSEFSFPNDLMNEQCETMFWNDASFFNTKDTLDKIA